MAKKLLQNRRDTGIQVNLNQLMWLWVADIQTKMFRWLLDVVALSSSEDDLVVLKCHWLAYENTSVEDDDKTGLF
jgi:hypothetical protein